MPMGQTLLWGKKSDRALVLAYFTLKCGLGLSQMESIYVWYPLLVQPGSSFCPHGSILSPLLVILTHYT